MDDKRPVLYVKKEECSGCAACEAICSASAIRMVMDEEGFLYPQIVKEKCIGCFLCKRVCDYRQK